MSKIERTKIKKTQIIVAFLSIIIGTLLHFTYEWSGENNFVASFSAVNESTWEHLKLVFFPMLILGIIEYFFIKKEVNNYIEAKTIGIFASICFVIVFFYTYTGILGTNFFIIDILTFILSIILGEYVAYKLMTIENQSTILSKVLSIGIIIFLFLCFVIFTYNPPKVNLFKDPTEKTNRIIQENN